MSTQMGTVTTPFDDLDEFLALPRVSGLAVAPDGSRVVPSISEHDEKPPAALWRLPAAGGEAAEALALPGGIDSVRCARTAPVTVVAAKLLRSASGVDEDKRLRTL